jgi:hypothetical protein
MQLRLTKPWIELTEANARSAGGHLGVYQLANDAGEVVYIGFAGGRELFGLRSALEQHARLRTAGATRFRYEVNMQYTSRHRELLMLHMADHNGSLPPGNERDHPVELGQIG